MRNLEEFRPNPANFGISKNDAGWLYFVRNGDLFKLGKTRNPRKRILQDARTWIPDLEIIGIKPFWNISALERALHTALAWNWYGREWFKFARIEEKEFFVEGFCEFYDDDRDMNSIDFIYWMNGSGMSEFTLERSRRGVSLRKWFLELSENVQTRPTNKIR